MHIKGKMLDLIISLTKIEETYFAIKNVISDKIQFTKGVPQGCVLSPLLFNLVLADFPFKNVDGQIFADDIGSWAKGRTPEEAQKTIKISVIEAVNWAKLNKMVFSNKTVAMIFNANKRNDLQRLEIDVDSLHIPLVNHTRNLGVKFKEKANTPIQDPHTGQITNDPKTIANILAAVLVNKREQIPSYSTEENNNMKKQIEVADKEKGDYDKDFDIEELYHVINKLPKNKSPGLDGITNDVIKEMGPKSKEFLCHLYNMCLAKARLPRAWDTSLIVPILKQGRNSLIPDNYRPIYLTTVFRKILEHLIKHRIEEKIDKALSRRQVGFIKKRSTIDAVVKLENEIKIGMQEKNSVYAIFYDLRSAFDSVPLQIVAQKLSMHIKGKMLDLIISLTKIEETYFAIKNVILDKIQFTKGVPQGCVLSPLLFNLVLADFPFKNVDGQIFADDIGSWAKGRTPEEAQKTIKISCALGGCMFELTKQLVIIMLGQKMINLSKFVFFYQKVPPIMKFWRPIKADVTDEKKRPWKFKEKANTPIQDPHTGQITNDPKTIANILAAVLVNKREQLPSYSTEENNNMKKQIEVAVKEKGDYDKDFDIEELYHVINKLPKNKSPGLDGITNDVIKEMGPKSKEFLCHLYNMCLAKPRLPRAWDTSLIVPILKQGRNSLIPDNYRPISLTNVFRKILEHLIKHRIEEKIDKALSRRQVGFIKKRSTIDAVVKLENEIQIGMQEKNSVYAIFYDLTSAFDSVPLQIVAQKLSMHIKGKMLDLIISLTKIEETYFAIKNVISDKIQFTKGVPQGCVLSPLLFNLVLADFPFKNVDGQIFADDIGSWAKGRTPEEAQKTIKISVIEAVNWAKLNKMVFSNKTVAMIFNANKRNDLQRLEIDVDSLHIPLVNHTRNLGVKFKEKANTPIQDPHTGQITNDPKTIANILAAVLVNKREQLPSYSTEENNTMKKQIEVAVKEKGDYDKDFDIEELYRVINKLPKNKSPGLDGIKNDVIKEMGPKSKEFLCHLYNMCLAKARLPMAWDTSLIVPIFKQGRNSLIPDNYRPISLTTVFRKILEHLIKHRIEEKIDKALSRRQVGFIKKWSTIDAVVKLENEIKIGMQEKNSVYAIFYDLTSAFDSVPLQIVAQKLSMHIKGKMLDLIISLTKIEETYFAIKNVISDKIQFTKGVPQGCVLSPLLFNLVLADFPFKNVDGQIFADDIGSWAKGRTPEEAQKTIKISVIEAVNWAKLNKMVFSNKTVAMIFNANKRNDLQRLEIDVDSLHIPLVNHTRNLGVKFKEKANTPIQDPHTGQITNDPKTIANILAAVLVNKREQLPSYSTEENNTMKKQIEVAVKEKGDYDKDFDIEELYRVINKLPKNKSPGLDGITNDVIKEMGPKSKEFLCHLYNMCLAKARLPMAWDTSLIVPIFKQGRNSLIPDNYRPISLTTVFRKILEHLIKHRIEEKIDKALSRRQVGFIKKRSTIDAVVKLENEIKIGMQEKNSVYAIFYDLTSAFDSVPLQIVAQKLSMHIKGKMLDLIISLTKIEETYFAIKNVISDKIQFTKGVPQGCVLSPLLFNLVLADFPFKNVDGQIFADDIGSWAKGRTPEEAQKTIKISVIEAVNWAKLNKMVFSNKTVAMIFNANKRNDLQRLEIDVDSLHIPLVNHTRNLGVKFKEKANTPIQDPHTGQITNDPKTIANILAAVLVNKREQLPSYSTEENNTMKKLIEVAVKEKGDYDKDFDIEELYHVINKLPKNKSPGLDGITNDVIKEMGPKSKEFLCHLYNMCLAKARLPRAWDTSLIVPILKQGRNSLIPDNYRPISLTTVFRKILEHLIKHRIEEKIDKALSRRQVGFRKKRSTIDAVVKLENEIKIGMQEKNSVYAIFYDLTSAFDSVPLQIVAQKLSMHIKGKMLDLIISLTKIEETYFAIKNVISDKIQFTKGVPQGCVLSPLLFNLVLADFPFKNVDGQIFADDIGSWAKGRTPEEAQKTIKISVIEAVNWAKLNKWCFQIKL
ncbi:hypothetical protein QYM36_001939 [Artemia franciscana]|uniref:Reverse transcriptase domain-containing protein n=1 Tax=Artemia franciscana TaxID=6661 RepID=A0AA88LIV8_ARTSF|nr:hypothetical protein QYM36_001939 [Artemia franciscana]